MTNGVKYTVPISPEDPLFVHADHLGTPRRMTDGARTVVWDHVTRPFGETYSLLGVFENNRRFSGQYFDSETELHYNYFRDYDPALGRYVQSDPIGLRGGLNTYAYGDGNAVRRFDRSGLFWVSVHVGLTNTEARNAGMGPLDSIRLGQLTGGVDSLPDSQEVNNSHWHAMRDPAWTVEEAEVSFDAWVEANSLSCSLENLAKALHAIQDSFAPGHEGFQEWHGVENTPRARLYYDHGIRDSGFFVPQEARTATRDAITRWLERCPCE